ncbi:MAG TPA: cyclic nucleotide-binding domain-containing protein [Anaerolineales bacterium]|nr:cyclic nucleotide-binding domain-containing protein [Anaerolineales bacterium]
MDQSTAERLNILRSVSIFTETPEESLLDAAGLLKKIEFKAGQKIFDKGDPGDCMYIIVHGKVKVHDGELILNYLGKWDVFGEMAALDPEPRSATVTAVEDTYLLRLGQADLYELMNRRTGVSRRIIQILCQRLRARMRDMVEDFEYMQQFARVTAAAVAVEAGVYVPESLNEVAARSDELGQLARVFQRMVREVDTREKRLKQQVAELRIEIDEVKKTRQVADITETEYFKELRNKARQLRAGRSERED